MVRSITSKPDLAHLIQPLIFGEPAIIVSLDASTHLRILTSINYRSTGNGRAR